MIAIPENENLNEVQTENKTKIAKFLGGPLDGDIMEIDDWVTVYKTFKLVSSPTVSSAPVQQQPIERQEFIYREDPQERGCFRCEEQ